VIAVELSARDTPAEQLTVGQVARRLGVARSTVYAHWREWGGYKLGRGDKAPIRFDSGALLVVADKPRSQQLFKIEPVSRPTRRHRRRRDLLVDAPRFAQPTDGIR
jgi:transposase-like protein